MVVGDMCDFVIKTIFCEQKIIETLCPDAFIGLDVRFGWMVL